jgi:hypothetical protein
LSFAHLRDGGLGIQVPQVTAGDFKAIINW